MITISLKMKNYYFSTITTNEERKPITNHISHKFEFYFKN